MHPLQFRLISPSSSRCRRSHDARCSPLRIRLLLSSYPTSHITSPTCRSIQLPLAAFLDDGKAEAKLQTVHKIFAAVQSRHASIVKAEIDRLSSPAGAVSRPVSRIPQRPSPSASMATAFSRRAANPAQGHSPYNARPMAAPRTGAVTPTASPASLNPRPRWVCLAPKPPVSSSLSSPFNLLHPLSARNAPFLPSPLSSGLTFVRSSSQNVQSSFSRAKATGAPGLRPARGAAPPSSSSLSSSSSSTVAATSPFKSPSRPRAKFGETSSPTLPTAVQSPVGRESSVTSGATSPPPAANFCYAGPSSVDVEVEGDIDDDEDDDDALQSTCQSYLGSTGLSSQALLSPTCADMARREPPQGVPRLQIERIPSTDQVPSAAEAAAAAAAAADASTTSRPSTRSGDEPRRTSLTSERRVVEGATSSDNSTSSRAPVTAGGSDTATRAEATTRAELLRDLEKLKAERASRAESSPVPNAGKIGGGGVNGGGGGGGGGSETAAAQRIEAVKTALETAGARVLSPAASVSASVAPSSTNASRMLERGTAHASARAT